MVQGGRDITIHQGVTAEDIKVILTENNKQILHGNLFAAVEQAKKELEEFKDKILEEVEHGRIRKEAFKEPDFAYVLERGQHDYARLDDTFAKDTLINLIARRSQETGRNRLSLSLNAAIEKASVLTRNEIAELSFCFFFRNVVGIASNFAELGAFFNTFLIPLLDDVSLSAPSYLYLTSQSCASINIASHPLHGLITRAYGGLLSKGFKRDELDAWLPNSKRNALNAHLIPCSNNPGNLQLNTLNRDYFVQLATTSGLNTDEAITVYDNAVQGRLLNENELIDQLETVVPRFKEVVQVWETTPLKQLELTSVGMAIAYANLARLGLRADLKIWIH